MAKIRLQHREVESGRLPRVCMYCGADATTERRRLFAWQPQWVLVLIIAGVVPYVIVASILTKRMQVFVPLCEVHKGHWLKRNLLIWLGLLVVVLAAIGSIALLSATAPGRNRSGEALGGIACLGGWVLLLAWVIVVIVARVTSIRPVEITDFNITLTRVSQAFVDAVDGGHDDWDYHESPRGRDDDDDRFEDRRKGR